MRDMKSLAQLAGKPAGWAVSSARSPLGDLSEARRCRCGSARACVSACYPLVMGWGRRGHLGKYLESDRRVRLAWARLSEFCNSSQGSFEVLGAFSLESPEEPYGTVTTAICVTLFALQSLILQNR